MVNKAQLKVMAPGFAAPVARRVPAMPQGATLRTAPSAGGATHRIVEALTEAIIERRLMPGTKLAEQQLADLFQVSRTLVRQALNQLSRDRLVVLSPARGAFVAKPSIDEAHQVFVVRKMVEASMVKQLCAIVTPAQVVQLRLHLQHESRAVQRDDAAGRKRLDVASRPRADVISRTRLLADFHVMLARMLGNEVLAQLLADLLARCSLIALMYQSSHSALHSADEHVAIVDAIERRDGRAAAKLMESHLGNVECSLQLQPRASDLAAALRLTPP